MHPITDPGLSRSRDRIASLIKYHSQQAKMKDALDLGTSRSAVTDGNRSGHFSQLTHSSIADFIPKGLNIASLLLLENIKRLTVKSLLRYQLPIIRAHTQRRLNER